METRNSKGPLAMDFEDLEPRAKPAKPKDLSSHSVEELRDYVGRLQAEIARAEQAIAAKQSYRAGAEAFFKR
jgi:uncharacterized small protein (DUF1192 family)